MFRVCSFCFSKTRRSHNLTDKYDKSWLYNHFLSARALAQADNVRAQLERTMAKYEVDLISLSDEKKLYQNIRQVLVCGFFMQVAHKEGEKGNYLTVKDNQVHVLSACLQGLVTDVICRSWRFTHPVALTLNPNGSSSMNLC